MMNDVQTNIVELFTKEHFFRASVTDLDKVPGRPIAYWVNNRIRALFNNNFSLEDITISDGQNITADNDTYLRFSWEINYMSVGPKKKWFFYAKGGEYRKWWGNLDHVIDWSPTARLFYKTNSSARIIPEYLWFRQGITWTLLSSGKTGFRILPWDATFDKTGSSIFLKNDEDLEFVLSLLCSNVSTYLLNTFSSTIAYQIKEIRKIPLTNNYKNTNTKSVVDRLVQIAKTDWNSYETSWDFASSDLLNANHHQITLKAAYKKIYAHWRSMTLEMQHLEEENNRIFIEAYGLQDELTPEVPLKEITLTCNPHYRYGGDKTEEELEALLLADTMREFISYAVGCMFGRYSLDKPGLVLANQGETLADYLAQVPEPTFMPDKDNVIPMLDGDWFADDIAERFRRFLRVTFGEDHYEENLRFIEEALNVKGKRSYSLRDYFLSEFYTDHLKRYKKRPIYWLFSSPKGSFNALIYMHRYRPDTVSVVLNDYLREFRAKLLARKNHLEALGISASTSQAEKTKALKEIEKISKMIAEVDAYERDTLYPLATQQLEIDLDDGVKANYPKFGAALKKIPGLEAKDD